MSRVSVHKSRNPKSDDLHKLIWENYLQYFRDKEESGVNFPFHLEREFKKYLRCGVFAHGFARFHCDHCGKDKLVAYSCKSRSFCPSCSGRRMADTAKHLVENVVPIVPVRQWVFSMPYKHRFLLSSNPKLLSCVLRIYQRSITGFYRKQAMNSKIRNPQVGGVNVIQRFGGALNLNVHFHTLFLDGVFFESKGRLNFMRFSPHDSDIEKLVMKLEKRVNRALVKRGYLSNLFDYEYDISEAVEGDQTKMQLESQSIAGFTEEGVKPRQIGKLGYVPYVEFQGRRCASSNGFSLHANVSVSKNKRDSLERICRYVCRGPIAKDRIDFSAGVVKLKLKKAYNDGTTHLEFTPKEFIGRVISLIPPPRQNLIRYFGVLGARYKRRSEVVRFGRSRFLEKKKTSGYNGRTPWPDLLKRIFKFEVDYCDYCDSCGTKLRLVGSISSYSACRRILDHLGLDSNLVAEEPARGSPENEFFDNQVEEFSQEVNW